MGIMMITEGQHADSVFIPLRGSNLQNKADPWSSLGQCSGEAGFEQFT